MKIAIGGDHGGFFLKNGISDYLKKKGHQVLDVGCFGPESCDYPEFGYRVAKLVSSKKVDKGILLCKSGIGQSIVANKVKGVRAALCSSSALARASRQHNDANVLVIAASYTDTAKSKRMVSTWLNTKFLGGRHARRIKQIELAAEEALVNIFRYAYPEEAGEVGVCCRLEDDARLIIEIFDNGVPFNPLSLSEPDLTADASDREIGGLGVFFIREMADDVQYHRDGTNNILRLSFSRQCGGTSGKR